MSTSEMSVVNRTTGIENMDEYDDPRQLSSAYCKQMSSDAFQQQTATETEQALSQLMEHLDKNPGVYKQLLQRRKQEQLEEAGLFSFMKFKILSAVQGDSYRGNEVSDQEVDEKLCKMTTNMARVFNYVQESKGTRFSQRLASKRSLSQSSTKQDTKPTRTKSSKMPSKSKLVPPPPPQAPPAALANVVSHKTHISKASSIPPPPPPPPAATFTPLRDRKNIIASTPANTASPKAKTPLNKNLTACTRGNLHTELTQSNPLKRLRSTTVLRSPGGTPVRNKMTRTTSSGSIASLNISSFDNEEPLMRSFLKVMHQKFRNIRTPSPRSSPRLQGRNSISSPLAQSPGGFTP